MHTLLYRLQFFFHEKMLILRTWAGVFWETENESKATISHSVTDSVNEKLSRATFNFLILTCQWVKSELYYPSSSLVGHISYWNDDSGKYHSFFNAAIIANKTARNYLYTPVVFQYNIIPILKLTKFGRWSITVFENGLFLSQSIYVDVFILNRCYTKKAKAVGFINYTLRSTTQQEREKILPPTHPVYNTNTIVLFNWWARLDHNSKEPGKFIHKFYG